MAPTRHPEEIIDRLNSTDVVGVGVGWGGVGWVSTPLRLMGGGGGLGRVSNQVEVGKNIFKL